MIPKIEWKGLQRYPFKSKSETTKEDLNQNFRKSKSSHSKRTKLCERNFKAEEKRNYNLNRKSVKPSNSESRIKIEKKVVTKKTSR